MSKLAGDYRQDDGGPDSTEYSAQIAFLAAIEEHASEPLRTLGLDVLPAYRGAEGAGALVDWSRLVQGPDRVVRPYLQAKATLRRFRAGESDADRTTREAIERLRGALFDWADSYHITVDWLLEVALLTLSGWASALEPDARPVLRAPVQGKEDSWGKAWFEAVPELGAWITPPTPEWLRARGVQVAGLGGDRPRSPEDLPDFTAHCWRPEILRWTVYRRLVLFKLERYREQIERQVAAFGWKPAPEFQGWNSISADAGFRYVALNRCAGLPYATIAEREGRSVDTIKRRARKVVAILNLPRHPGGHPRKE